MVFGIFKKIFKSKKEEQPMSPLTGIAKPGIAAETTSAENMKAKMDLVLAELDSLRVQYEAINQRIQTIETMVKELYAMAKS